MANKSKRKGNSFENKIYKDLREVIPSIKKTIGSGNSELDADLISKDFIFELKCYKKVTGKQLDEWVDKLRGEAIRHSKIPILVYKENYKPIQVIWAHCFNDDVMCFSYLAFKEIMRETRENE